MEVKQLSGERMAPHACALEVVRELLQAPLAENTHICTQRDQIFFGYGDAAAVISRKWKKTITSAYVRKTSPS